MDTYLVIEDLSPGSPYQFRVSASNPWGISLPSEPSEFVRLPEYGESPGWGSPGHGGGHLTRWGHPDGPAAQPSKRLEGLKSASVADTC